MFIGGLGMFYFFAAKKSCLMRSCYGFPYLGLESKIVQSKLDSAMFCGDLKIGENIS